MDELKASQEVPDVQTFTTVEDIIDATPDAKRLLAFNGYYALNNLPPGSFFAIDANVHVVMQPRTATLIVNLVYCFDGKTSTTVPFTGHFDGRWLYQDNGIRKFQLEFERYVEGKHGLTAHLSGTVNTKFLPSGGTQVTVSGSTFNNPIPMSLFVGTYYELLPEGTRYLPVASITSDRGLVSVKYDWGKGDRNLTPVTEFIYNYNMYYFVLANPDNPFNEYSPKLIMGTALNQGLACQNIYEKPPKTSISRQLRTIPHRLTSDNETTAPNAQTLAGFSGYYSLDSIAPGAFVLIQGQYRCRGGNISDQQVAIAFSLDGVNSKSYYYGDNSHMTFDPITRVLITPDLNLTFARAYDPATGALTSVSGTVAGRPAKGRNYFNPVPLRAFGPARMFSTDPTVGKLSVQVMNDTTVAYTSHDGKSAVYKDFVYIPLMYVWWNLHFGELSFGTDGAKGVACIVMTATDTLGGVWAVPGANV
jgi:hypothetical protein